MKKQSERKTDFFGLRFYHIKDAFKKRFYLAFQFQLNY